MVAPNFNIYSNLCKGSLYTSYGKQKFKRRSRVHRTLISERIGSKGDNIQVLGGLILSNGPSGSVSKFLYSGKQYTDRFIWNFPYENTQMKISSLFLGGFSVYCRDFIDVYDRDAIGNREYIKGFMSDAILTESTENKAGRKHSFKIISPTYYGLNIAILKDDDLMKPPFEADYIDGLAGLLTEEKKVALHACAALGYIARHFLGNPNSSYKGKLVDAVGTFVDAEEGVKGIYPVQPIVFDTLKSGSISNVYTDISNQRNLEKSSDYYIFQSSFRKFVKDDAKKLLTEVTCIVQD